MSNLKKLLLLPCLIALSLQASPSKQKGAQQEKMVMELETLANCFEQNYGMKEWKNQQFNWTLKQELNKAKKKIKANPNLSSKEFRVILLDFCNSMKDYHVSIMFYSTESASLPFDVMSAEDHYFARSTSGKGLFREIIAFNGTPIKQAVEAIQKRYYNTGSTDTDLRMALQTLTHRSGASGHIVPKGEVAITMVDASGIPTTETYHWNYQADKMIHSMVPPTSLLSHTVSQREFTSPMKDRFEATSLFSDLHQPFPQLGKVISKGPPGLPSAFGTVIYELEGSKKRVGYLRIPHFMGTDTDVKQFRSMIEYLEANTDALVINQTRNPGGMVYYMMALLSSLSEKPLHFISDSVVLTHGEAELALMMSQTFSDSKILQYMSDIFGYPINQEFLNSQVAYYDHVYNEYAQAKKQSSPFPLFGLATLTVHPVHYTKPIVCVIDELDFSCGDFFPSILQDNERAILFGNKTAGAGGTVRTVTYPNEFGVKMVGITASLSRRANGEVVENRGVTPDVVYKPTAEDLTNGGQGYKNALIQTINQAIEHIPH